MMVEKEEKLGKIDKIFELEKEEEVIEKENEKILGIEDYLYKENLRSEIRVREEMEYGMVGKNKGII